MAMNENEEFEFRLRAEQEAAQQRAIPKPQDSQAALKEVIAEQGFLGRNAASLGSAPVKLYLGVKQLMNGGKLSPEDQQLKKDWDTIEEGGTTGAITGNVATMLLPGGAMAKAGQAAGLPALVRVGQAITNPQSLKAAAAVGAGYAALQPTTEQGGDGFVQRGKNLGLGALSGAAGYGVAAGLGKAFNPKIDPDIELLRKEGITPTIGQIAGGRAQVTESKLTSVPVMGDLIANNQSKGIDSLNVAAYNRALSPIGEKSSGDVGFKGVEEVQKKLSEKYAELTGKMSFKPDEQFAGDMSKIRVMIDELPEQYAKMYDKMIDRIVIGRSTPQGNMSGETLKSVESELTKQISKLRSGAAGYEHSQIADALEAAQGAIRENLARQSPEWAKELAKVNQGWANYAIIRDAASTATGRKGGAFTPANLAAAVAANAKKSSGQAAGKGKIASGRALMQDLASAAENRLAPAYPDSGTTGRALAGLAAGGAGYAYAPGAVIPALAGVGIGSIPYLPGANKLAAMALTQRPELLRQLGVKASEIAPYAAIMGASAGADY